MVNFRLALTYAFELLAKMYLERGYREREIPGLVLSKNLHGMEIDPRAAQIARLALAMCARELDRRFFGRGVRADIAVLAPVALGEGDVPRGSALEKKKDLLDALAHLDEVGSLLAPDGGDLAAIREAVALAGDGGLFGSSSKGRLRRALATCETLARRYDCVVANPPYMGSSSFGPFMSRWVKKSYPDVKSDLCTCFIERNLSLAKVGGFASLVTSDTCMYLSSFIAMRTSLVENNTILTFADTRGTNAHADVFDANAIWVLRHGRLKGYEGSYFKLNHRIPEKAGALFEAIKNPDCGWFYRRDAETFKQIPGTPIAYWVGDGILSAFKLNPAVSTHASLQAGITTGNNDLFIRAWWEVQLSKFDRKCSSINEVQTKTCWYPCNKGGNYRKWYGNRDNVMNFSESGQLEMRKQAGYRPVSLEDQFRPSISWSDITTDLNSFRVNGGHNLFEHAGSCAFTADNNLFPLIAYLNSSAASVMLHIINPTVNCNAGVVSRLPLLGLGQEERVSSIAESNIEMSRADWDSFETSWNFKRHPLI